MQFTIDTGGSGKDTVDYEKNPDTQKTDIFVRDDGDNYLFKEIQVEDITTLIRPETVFYEDYDTPVYRAASMVEEKRIKVVCKTDPSITFDCKNITSFWGRGNTISSSSELGIFNIEREVQGLTPMGKEDFEVEDYQVLKGEEDKLLETAKIQLLKSMKETRLQYKIPKIIPVIGSGSCFREDLPTCRKYKGQREESARPILLKKLRQWLVEERGAIDVKDLRHEGKVIECDDFIEMKAYEGVQHYRKHGWYNIGVISSDKDALNSSKLIVNRDRVKSAGDTKGKLKFPKPMHILPTDQCAGDVVLVSKGDADSKEVKGYGFKFLMYQFGLGKDSADNYDALSHLDQGLNFGDIAAYKALKSCKTAKEALQATIDVFAELLPYGVQYTDWQGREFDVDTFTYMSIYFKVAYMIRRLNDPMTFGKLCEAFKVDTSKIVGNNKFYPPVKTYVGNEENIVQVESVIQEILKEKLKGFKQLKKQDAADRVDEIKLLLESISFDSHYEMISLPKEVC